MNRQRFDEETLTSSLKLLAEEMASLDAPPEIEQKLRETFRSRAAMAAASKRSARYWLAAVAAVLLIAISVIALRWRTEEPKQIRAQQIEQPQVKEEPVPVRQTPKQPEVEVVVQKPRRRAVRRPPSSEVANHVNREIATDFISLGYMNPAALQDGGQIVRVELPRSALVNFGLPVNMNRYNDKVKADVLFGVDGLAHAIRFVK